MCPGTTVAPTTTSGWWWISIGFRRMEPFRMEHYGSMSNFQVATSFCLFSFSSIVVGRTFTEDQTDKLRSNGYWISYNRAFYPEVHTLSGEADMALKHGEYFSYTDTPRAKIMAREQAKVVDEETMIQFMRYNDFQNDPEAVVEGCNNPIPAGAVANR